VLDHMEAPDASRRWPVARNIDLDYAIDLRSFLTRRKVSRNGRSTGQKRPMSARQIRNVLEALRMVLDWAVRTGVRLLPVDFVNPITPEILGPMPVKDPLREVALPLPARIAMLARMDDWQFLNLAALLVLPLRHEDAARALISDVDLAKGELRLGDHFGGCDFAKGKVNVSMPLPPALIALFRVCVGERAEGPLFLSRRRRRGTKKVCQTALDPAAFRAAFDRELSKRPTQDIQAPLDRKRVYCEFLEQQGGVTADEVAKEIRKVLPDRSTHPYALRHGVTQDMHESGIAHLELRYLTAHSASDILNEYVRLNPKAEMQKYYERCQDLLQPIEERVQRLTQSHALH
jgi:integrase